MSTFDTLTEQDLQQDEVEIDFSGMPAHIPPPKKTLVEEAELTAVVGVQI